MSDGKYVFFNRGSVVSKGSAGLPVLSKKIKLCPTFAATTRFL